MREDPFKFAQDATVSGEFCGHPFVGQVVTRMQCRCGEEVYANRYAVWKSSPFKNWAGDDLLNSEWFDENQLTEVVEDGQPNEA